MPGKNSLRKFITLSTVAVVLCVYSSVAFAIPATMTGAITVLGQVTVNGQPAFSNSTVFSGSTIAAGDDSSAIIGFGKSGRIAIGSKTTLALSFHEGLISGELTSGSVTVLSSAKGVQVKTLSGKIVVLNAGETATADSDNVKSKQDDDDDDDKISGGALFALMALGAGAVAAIIWATTRNDDINVGGNVVIVSPTR